MAHSLTAQCCLADLVCGDGALEALYSYTAISVSGVQGSPALTVACGNAVIVYRHSLSQPLTQISWKFQNPWFITGEKFQTFNNFSDTKVMNEFNCKIAL